MASIKLSPSRAKLAKTTAKNGNGPAKHDYFVSDLSLAEWGRKTIQVSEHEMPGLMSIRDKYGTAQAAQGRAHHRFAAHDHRDGHPDRDARGTRRVRALGQLQYFLHPGPRRRRDCPGRHPGVRLQGRNARGILGFHPRRAHASRQQRPATHRGRRRRRHAAHPQRLRTGKRQRLGQHPQRQPRSRRHQESAETRRQGTPRFLARSRERLERRFRRNHHRRASPVSDARSRENFWFPPSTSTTPSPNQNSTISTAAANRSPTASSARPT